MWLFLCPRCFGLRQRLYFCVFLYVERDDPPPHTQKIKTNLGQCYNIVNVVSAKHKEKRWRFMTHKYTIDSQKINTFCFEENRQHFWRKRDKTVITLYMYVTFERKLMFCFLKKCQGLFSLNPTNVIPTVTLTSTHSLFSLFWAHSLGKCLLLFCAHLGERCNVCTCIILSKSEMPYDEMSNFKSRTSKCM
jgi:hypothetical protein